MKQPRSSVDGFIPRRSGAPIGRHQAGNDGPQPRPGLRAPENRPQSGRGTGTLERTKTLGLVKADIDESLKQIDDSQPIEEKKRRRWRLKRPQSKRKVVKWLLIALIAAGLMVGGWLAYKAFYNVDSVFKGGLLGLAQKKPLKQDANGRSNVLIFGTSEDSPDHNISGDGPMLTDSMMVLSVNQEKKDAFMISIPRDLWVKFDEPCSVGWQEKINSVYQCGSNFGENPEAGAAALRKKVGEVLGLDIQYYGQVDYSVVTKAVDAVGGVDVTIESNPPGVGILDRNFDWRCNYQCYYVKYDDGQKVHLDGEHALALSRARNASGGYGIGDNFGREKNQQKVLKALREKALSAGTLTNVGKVTDLLDVVGKNLKTNVDKSEVQTIMSLANDIQTDAIKSLNLNDPEAPLVHNSNVGRISVVVPIAGMFDYSKIKAYIAKSSSTDPVVKEGASIDVLNGSGVAGAAQNESNWLEGQGLTIGQIGNAPAGNYTTARVYQRTENLNATKTKLESLYGVKVETTVPTTIASTADFVVIISQNNPTR